MVELPELVPELNDQPTAPGRTAYLNTPEHSENSRRLQSRVFEFIVTHPGVSARHAVFRLYQFLKVPTRININDPAYPELWLYRALVWLGCLHLLANVLLLGYRIVASRSLEPFGEPESILNCSLVLYIATMAVGDSGEEARFLISVLPLIAAVMARSVSGAQATRGAPPGIAKVSRPPLRDAPNQKEEPPCLRLNRSFERPSP